MARNWSVLWYVRSWWIRSVLDRCQAVASLDPAPGDSSYTSAAAELLGSVPQVVSQLESTVARGLLAELMLRQAMKHGALGAEGVSLLDNVRLTVGAPAVSHASRHPKVTLALILMKRRYADPSFCLQDVASTLGVTRFHISRLLRKETGIGFVGHVRRFRLDKAAMLLATTSWSVKEIAAQLGFHHAGDLTRNFRQQYGEPPTTWRLMHVRTLARRKSRMAKVTEPRRRSRRDRLRERIS